MNNKIRLDLYWFSLFYLHTMLVERRDYMKELSRQKVQHFKDIYPPGARITVDNMPDDPRPIPSGTKGKVIAVDDIGTIHCTFENGRQLGLIPGVDSFHVVKEELSGTQSITEEPELQMNMT